MRSEIRNEEIREQNLYLRKLAVRAMKLEYGSHQLEIKPPLLISHNG